MPSVLFNDSFNVSEPEPVIQRVFFAGAGNSIVCSAVGGRISYRKHKVSLPFLCAYFYFALTLTAFTGFRGIVQCV